MDGTCNNQRDVSEDVLFAVREILHMLMLIICLSIELLRTKRIKDVS